MLSPDWKILQPWFLECVYKVAWGPQQAQHGTVQTFSVFEENRTDCTFAAFRNYLIMINMKLLGLALGLGWAESPWAETICPSHSRYDNRGHPCWDTFRGSLLPHN